MVARSVSRRITSPRRPDSPTFTRWCIRASPMFLAATVGPETRTMIPSPGMGILSPDLDVIAGRPLHQPGDVFSGLHRAFRDPEGRNRDEDGGSAVLQLSPEPFGQLPEERLVHQDEPHPGVRPEGLGRPP